MRKLLAASASIGAIAVLFACSSIGQRGTTSLLPSTMLMPLATTEYAYVTNYGDSNISGYSIGSTGALTEVKGSPFGSGTGPTAMAVSPNGKFAFSANTGSTTSKGTGNVSAYTIDSSTGALAAVKGSPFTVGQEPSGVAVDPTSKYLYVSCYEAGNIYAFTINASTGALTAVKGSPFTAEEEPDYVAVDPKGKYVYDPNYGASNLSGFAIEKGGALKALSGSPFKTDGGAAAGVTLNATGKFLYSTNYGSDSVSAFTVASSGALKAVKGMPYAATSDPTNVIVSPDGKFAYVSNAASSGGSISAYTINSTTGALKQVKGSPFAAQNEPEYVVVDPSGKFVYAPNTGSNTISGYSIGSTGALTALKGSPFSALDEPAAIAVCAVKSGKCIPPPL